MVIQCYFLAAPVYKVFVKKIINVVDTSSVDFLIEHTR